MSDNTSLNKYAEMLFGKFLKDDSINEVCYQGGNLIWCEDIQGK